MGVGVGVGVEVVGATDEGCKERYEIRRENVLGMPSD